MKNARPPFHAPPLSRGGYTAHQLAQVIGPIDHRRQADGRRQAQADASGRRQMPALDYGVGEMRRADHDAVDFRAINAGIFDHGPQRLGDAFRYVGGGRRFGRADDRGAIHQDSVGVRPADVYSDSHVMFSFAFGR